MENKVGFTMRNILSGEDRMNVTILTTSYTKIWSGEVGISGQNVMVDIGTLGSQGQEVWVYCNTIPVVEGDPLKTMGGYSTVSTESGWYDLATGMVLCSEGLLECNGEIIECL